MRKKLMFLKILVCTLFICMFAVNGCTQVNEEGKNVHTITFIQEGQKNIVYEVENGGSLTDLPNPADIPGYEVSWSITDFSNITEDLTVTIMRQPKIFEITYLMGILEGNNGVIIKSLTQSVEYNSAYVTYAPTCEGYEFLGWKMNEEDELITSGTYLYTENITLIAEWKLVNNELGWSGVH